MKKLFLFLSGALLSLGLSATEYNVLVDKFTVDDITANNGAVDFEFTNQIPQGTVLVAGDVINVTVKGYFNSPVEVTLNAIVDACEEGGYWNPLAEGDNNWIGEKLGAAVVGEEFNETRSYTLAKDALKYESYKIQFGFTLKLSQQMTYGKSFKMRPTEAELNDVSSTYAMEFTSLLFSANGTNYKAEVPFETSEVMKAYDKVEVAINGKFNQDVNALVFMVFDEGGTEVQKWTPVAFSAKKDETVDTKITVSIEKDCNSTKLKLGVFIDVPADETVYKFLKDGDVEHDPVEVAKKDYTEVTMSYNQYATPANYQFIDASIAENVQVGDYVTFSVTGKASAAFSKMIGYVRNASYSAISNQVVVAENVLADGTVQYSGKIEITAAAESCDLVFEITDEATAGSSITIGEGSTAVEDVTAFAVVNGKVFSAGDIVVYNVAGKIVATASQEFDVTSLEAGIYFISAQEGVIKFVK